MRQGTCYRETWVDGLRGLRTLDGRRVTEEERRLAGILLQREEEKRTENRRQEQVREERVQALAVIQQYWVDYMAYRAQTDTQPSPTQAQPLTVGAANTPPAPPAGIAVLNGELLTVYGPTPDIFERSWPLSVTHIVFQYVIFDSVVPQISKVNQCMGSNPCDQPDPARHAKCMHGLYYQCRANRVAHGGATD